MIIEVKEDADVVTISVFENIEATTIAYFKKILFEINKTTNKNIEIDFATVDYIDSSGFTMLESREVGNLLY